MLSDTFVDFERRENEAVEMGSKLNYTSEMKIDING